MWRVAHLKTLNQLLGNGEKNFSLLPKLRRKKQASRAGVCGQAMAMELDISWSLRQTVFSGFTFISFTLFLQSHFFYLLIYLGGLYLLYNIVLVSAVQ